MSGVYIPDMEMPTSCFECRFSIDGFCYASGEVNTRANEERQITNYCPLVPVPTHGDLIERDALTISTAVPLDGKPYQYVHIDNIKGAPTIIPADHIGDVNEMVTDKEGEG